MDVYQKTLADKLAVDGQNFIYCPQFQENVQKPPNIADFEGFWTFS